MSASRVYSSRRAADNSSSGSEMVTSEDWEVVGVRSKRTGFTLIELLVVIAIIAILAAILFPVFLQAKRAGQAAGCKSNLAQLYKAMRMYMDDWMGRVPNLSSDCKWGERKANGCLGWCENLYRYHKKIDLYRCPARNVTYSYTMNEALDYVQNPPRQSQIILMGEAPGCGEGTYNDPTNFYRGWTDMSTGKGGGQNDGWRCNVGNGDLLPDHTIDMHANIRKNMGDKYGTKSGPYDDAHWVFFPGPHNGANNILFLDGHVGSFTDWAFGRMTFGWMYTPPPYPSQPKPIKYK